MPEAAQERAFAELQSELVHERARSLGRAGRKVEGNLDRCRELQALLTVSQGDDQLEAVLADYRTARHDFDEALWAFCVQREAIGLHDHRWVHRIYAAPPSVADVRARLATR